MMKKTLLSMATAMVVVSALGKLPAQANDTLWTVTPDWHYRWHEGRWWYWMPEDSSWMVWIGSTWVPYEEVADCPNVFAVGQAVPYSSSYGSYEAEDQIAPVDPGYSNAYGRAYSTGTGSDYSGYGWGWGPGTAYRDGPGRRF